MVDRGFFKESKQQSAVKARIVKKYFHAWSRVMVGSRVQARRIAYVDLFAGPGRYQDGHESTPLLVLQQALSDRRLVDKLITVFNDQDAANTEALLQEIKALPDIDALRYAPVVLTQSVDAEIMTKVRAIIGLGTPTLFFVDPWGYKGLSLSLLNDAIAQWGCDCIFFFNYVRINAGLENPVQPIEQHMDQLFGKDRADSLRSQLDPLDSHQREATIIDAIKDALGAGQGTRYVTEFKFKKGKGQRTSHYLIFVSKHALGEKIMKEIMAKESSDEVQGVASFEYTPTSAFQGSLFSHPLEELKASLLLAFAGRELTVEEVYHLHHPGTPYVEKNYRQALLELEAESKVTVSPPAEDRRTRGQQLTLPRYAKVNFPK